MNGNRTAQVAIIGAGIAGIACARQLSAAGLQPRLFDKGRRPGGRLASREINTPDGPRFVDHGAQFFTARGAAFAEEVAAFVRRNKISPWSFRAQIRDRNERRPLPDDTRFVGVPCMNAWAAELSKDLDVASNTGVKAILSCGNRHALRLQDNSVSQHFDAVILAIPAPQAADLLADSAPGLAVAARSALFAPCWAAWCALPSCSSHAFDALRLDDSGPLAWIARQKGGPEDSESLWLVHASAAWSRMHLEDDPGMVGTSLVAALQSELQVNACPRLVGTHRWRHALVERALGVPFKWDADLRLGTCGDWHLGPRVELAWQSGHELARAVLISLDRGD